MAVIFCVPSSERVPYSEMERKRVFKGGHVVIAAAACVVGCVYPDAEVAADDEHTDVKPQSHARAEREILEESGCLQLGAWAVGVVFKQPHVACVKEQCSVEWPEDWETIFDIGLKLERACLVEITVDFVGRGAVGAGADRPDGESADRVGSAAIELLAIWNLCRVSVGMGRSGGNAAYQPVIAPQPTAINYLHRAFDKL